MSYSPTTTMAWKRSNWKRRVQRVQQNDPLLTKIIMIDRWDDQLLMYLTRALQNNTQLATVAIHTHTLRARTARDMAKAMCHSRIQRLELYHRPPEERRYYYYDDAQATEILYREGIQNQRSSVRQLQIHQCIGNIHALVTIIPRLVTLDIACAMTRDEFAVLKEALRTSTLEELHLRSIPLHDDDGNGFLAIPSLKRFKLVHVTIPSNFLDAWPRTSQLQTLELHVCQWDHPDSVRSLLQATANVPALETLSLDQSCSIGYPGLKFIAALLATNTLTLQHLVLRYCANHGSDNVRHDLSLAFLQALQTNTHLHSLDLFQNQLTLDGKEVTFHRAIQYYTARNRVRSFWTNRHHGVPPATWCRVMSYYRSNPDCIYHVLQQQPILVARR